MGVEGIEMSWEELKSNLVNKDKYPFNIEDHYVPEPRDTRTEKAHRCPEAYWY